MKTSSRSLWGMALLTLALLILGLGGCATQSPLLERATGPSADALLRQAEQQDPSQAAATRFRAADILAREGKDTQAMEVLANLDDGKLPPQQRVQWALLLSRLALDNQDDSRVLQATALLEEGLDLPLDQANTLLERRGLALGNVGEPLASLEALLAVQSSTDDDTLNDAIWRQLSRLDTAGRGELAKDANSLTRGWLSLLELQRQSNGDISRFFDQLETWRSENPRHPAARRLPEDLVTLGELRGTRVERMAILLPSDGPLAEVAKQIRQGIESRHAIAEREGDQPPDLIYLDTYRADLESLYAQAVMNGAQVVLGPLSKEKVSELESRQQLPLPTLALNYGTASRSQASNLFQYGLSVEDEAEVIARGAARDGHRLAAALVPDNDWGQRVGEAFKQAFEEQNGEVAVLLHYNPKEPVNHTVARLLRRSGDVDMLFLLALPSYARQVPPNLDYHDAREMPIYATSQSYEGRPQPRIDQDLNDIRFVDIPWLIPDAAAGGADALPFGDSYQELSEDKDPGLLKLNAMGVDAFELGRRLPQLQALPGNVMSGATGRLGIGDNGRIERDLPWAQFADGVPQLPR
ncbi:penicillin-binding protein activator [Pistricoccus aurantiacus]|uniref:penicillin-binding protein activator n=1 Tax=Pistricoccus aurantiacus TaxID=1883414 RepID=UPI00364288CD